MFPGEKSCNCVLYGRKSEASGRQNRLPCALWGSIGLAVQSSRPGRPRAASLRRPKPERLSLPGLLGHNVCAVADRDVRDSRGEAPARNSPTRRASAVQQACTGPAPGQTQTERV